MSAAKVERLLHEGRHRLQPNISTRDQSRGPLTILTYQSEPK